MIDFKSKFILPLVLLTGIHGNCHADEISTPASRETIRSTWINVEGAYIRVKSETGALNGIGGGFSLSKFVSSKVSFDGGVVQFNSSDRFTALLSSLRAGANYYLLGSGQKKITEVSSGGRDLANFQSAPSAGLFLGLFLSQSFFNTSTSTLMFSGPGLQIGANYPIFESVAAGFSLRYSQISNGGLKLTPMEVALSCSYLLN